MCFGSSHRIFKALVCYRKPKFTQMSGKKKFAVNDTNTYTPRKKNDLPNEHKLHSHYYYYYVHVEPKIKRSVGEWKKKQQQQQLPSIVDTIYMLKDKTVIIFRTFGGRCATRIQFGRENVRVQISRKCDTHVVLDDPGSFVCWPKLR